MSETKKCKHCQTDIPKKAKVCPNCKRKQGGKLKTVLLVILVLGIIGSIKYPVDESVKLKVSEIKYNDHEYIIFKTSKYGSSKEIIHSPNCKYCKENGDTQYLHFVCYKVI